MSDDFKAQLATAQKAFDAFDDKLTLSLCEVLWDCPDATVRAEARNLRATVFFTAQRYAEAASDYRDLAKSTGRPDFALSAVTSSAMAHEYDLAETYFQMAKLLIEDRVRAGQQDYSPLASVKISSPFLCLYYAFALVDSGAPERALAPLGLLSAAYEALKVKDDHFLLTRGVPPFGVFVQLCKRVPNGHALVESLATADGAD